ncbi:MAG: glycosyltransferase family 4 protein [Bacteroidetes bacterium]|nr:MAG: glycosyltransferase family 4 protein [Bacteroidota bacterium]
MRKKILIITLNDYIIYQPTILNLYDKLSDKADVKIISFRPQFATKKKDEKRNIEYLETNYWLTQFYTKTDFIVSKVSRLVKLFNPKFAYHHLFYNKYLPSILKHKLSKEKDTYDEVIAVDLQVLYLAQQYFGAVHFLSLEVDNNTNEYYKKIDHSKIKSVFVQSEIRYAYMFPGKDIRRFIVQNAPDYKELDLAGLERKDFIWAGAIDRRLAVLECLEFFNQHPDFKLVLKGGGDYKTKRIIDEKYGHLLSSQRVVIDQSYLDAGEFVKFLSSFRIGFCFYDWDLIKASFNYQTAPSGKMFMYLAAGTPVIACKIPGFDFVEKFGCGVLIHNYEPATIANAVKLIEADHKKYSDACIEAAKYFSFDKSVNPYLEFLLTQSQ